MKYKDSIGSWSNKSRGFSFSSLSDPIEKERCAQLEEHRRKQKKEGLVFPKENHKHAAKKNSKLESMDLKENLEKTWKWLSETFPFLFGKNTTRPLDTHIVRDIKDHYKRYQVKNRYPKDLIIKATLSRYVQTPGYLRCLQEGTFKYNIHGTAVETVTKAEEEKALQLLKQIM